MREMLKFLEIESKRTKKDIKKLEEISNDFYLEYEKAMSEIERLSKWLKSVDDSIDFLNEIDSKG